MVKIVAVCGSPRKSATLRAMEYAIEAAEAIEGVTVERIVLSGLDINKCIGCNKCVRDDSPSCSIYVDDMTDLYDKFYEADGYIIASPVYDMNITSQLATFFDRFRSTWIISQKDPDFFLKKTGVAIAVGGTRNGGQESTLNAINNFYITNGIIPAGGGSGAYAGACVWSKDQGKKGVDADDIGIKYCRQVGHRVAVVAKLLSAKQD